MGKVGVFLDITDLYYKLLREFKNGKLDYQSYLSHIKEITGKDIGMAVAYGCQSNDEAEPFIGYLRSIGFRTKYKKPYILKIGDRDIKRCSWQVALTVDALNAVGTCDTVVLCTSNPDILPLVRDLRDKNVEVIIYACNVPANLAKAASRVIEITSDNLESKE
jgi:uncharacterized LabA/DUF88 family protein